MEIDRASRCSSKYTIGIDIGVQRRIEGSPEATVATLGELVDDIATFLQSATLSMFPAAQCIGISNDPIYLPEHLLQKRTFTSVLTVKYILLSAD
jgi:hypothetical protein